MLTIIISCSSNNEVDDAFNGQLVGTVWVGTGTQDGETVSFPTTVDVKYVERGAVEIGTYTFDGQKGELIFSSTDKIPFRITGIKLIMEDDEDNFYVKE